MSKILKTVGDLKREIEHLPDDMKLTGYTGDDRDHLITIIVIEDEFGSCCMVDLDD